MRITLGAISEHGALRWEDGDMKCFEEFVGKMLSRTQVLNETKVVYQDWQLARQFMSKISLDYVKYDISLDLRQIQRSDAGVKGCHQRWSIHLLPRTERLTGALPYTTPPNPFTTIPSPSRSYQRQGH